MGNQWSSQFLSTLFTSSTRSSSCASTHLHWRRWLNGWARSHHITTNGSRSKLVFITRWCHKDEYFTTNASHHWRGRRCRASIQKKETKATMVLLLWWWKESSMVAECVYWQHPYSRGDCCYLVLCMAKGTTIVAYGSRQYRWIQCMAKSTKLDIGLFQCNMDSQHDGW